MQPIRLRLILAAALAAAAPAIAQDTAAPASDAQTENPAPENPTSENPTPENPTPENPASENPTPDAPATAAPESSSEPAPAADGADEAPAAAAGSEAKSDAGDPAKPEVMEIVKDTFGDWEIRCAPDGSDCFMYQLARDQENNPVAEVSILKLPEQAQAAAGVTVVTPLGTLLPSGMVVQVDNGEKRQYPFAWCSQVGCFSRFGLDAPALASMKRGKAGTITLVSISKPNQPVNLALSLTGFTAAYDALEVPTPPAQPAEAPAAQN